MLTRWDPFQEMLSLRSTVDRLLDNSFGLQSGSQSLPGWGLALDVIEKDDEFLVKGSIPGINPDDIEITFTDNVLTIKGETKVEDEVENTRYHLRERRYGAFSRSLALGSRIKGDAIQASYDNGVLTLHLPKAEEVKPKRISIKASSPKVIEAKASDSKKK